ncbi:protein-L-isoaspartate(D-aspartate) O-methyltransferase [Thalassotalea fonticola]|uniref:Protein-L-isoaspartate O-methyltransferase n=1 Tax=Thalassotalea fonticola TaxID=3065649 RepID=A0ABZ0GPD4_9GAMM|nr:protein-L-isoaspartate(D-aspartate) O-methyltransferase [Colwelliaceae bacterium S1-1]
MNPLCVLAMIVVSFPASVFANHQYPEATQFQQQRNAMVDTLSQKYRGLGLAVEDMRVLNAMRKVPRHRFMPKDQHKNAYRDSPVKIGYGQTISQPYIVALMSQLAEVESGMSVLEIGTGSGYQAAILFELTSQVYTMEIISPLAKRTQETFQTLGLLKIKHQHGDGYYGWPGELKFDRIMVTAAAAHIPPPLLKQLKPNGRMVIPVGPVWGNQQLLLIEKDLHGKSTTRSILPVRFVPLTGRVFK